MKHQSQKQIHKTNMLIAISVIKKMLSEGRVEDAKDICEKKSISAEQFEKIVEYSDRDTQEIYSLVF